MHIETDEEGSPFSAFATAMSAHDVPEQSGPSDPHLLQILNPRILQVCKSMEDMSILILSGSDAIANDCDSIHGEMVTAFRRLIYDATELMDFYAKILPVKLFQDKAHREILREFKTVAKNCRDPISAICNRLKHDAVRLVYHGARSTFVPCQSYGFRCMLAEGKESIVIDRMIHRGRERRSSFARKVHEILHEILRVDLKAARAIAFCYNKSPAAKNLIKTNMNIPQTLKMLKYTTVYLVDESHVFRGVSFSSGAILLESVTGVALPAPARFVVVHVGDGYTRHIEVW